MISTFSRRLLPTLAGAFAFLCVTGHAAEAKSPSNQSLRNELEAAIQRGARFLEKQQQADGHWSDSNHPAVTAMALLALRGQPQTKADAKLSPELDRGYRFLTGTAKPDGGLYVRDLPNYNTSLSLLALLAANRPDYDPLLRSARKYLVGLQNDLDEKGKQDSVFDGGIGYGSKYNHSDMGNTIQALEALYYSKHLVADQKLADAKDLDWKAVIGFIQNCQNLPSHNTQLWVSGDITNKGGFVYYPGMSMAGGETNATTGKVALRSYGSVSYGGLLSYVYANLSPNDPRVLGVLDWLGKNYTLEENPGMGPQGLFYYYHTMSKALSAAGIDELQLANGTRAAWRQPLGLRLLNLQKSDGSWANDNGRWWEKDAVLVTAYAMLTLQRIHAGL
ncbi:MAG TPA: cycloartenol synthase [Roseimicrobium sp.]|nr:cycloartenol synthase [Roseimicrobium sp.]